MDPNSITNNYLQLVQGFEASREIYSEHANNKEFGYSAVSSSRTLSYTVMVLSGLIAKANRTLSYMITNFRMCVTSRIPLGGRDMPYVLDVLIDRYLFEDVVFSEEFKWQMLLGSKEWILKYVKLLSDVMSWGLTVRPEYVRCHAYLNPRCTGGSSNTSKPYTEINRYLSLKLAYDTYIGSRRRLCHLRNVSIRIVASKTFHRVCLNEIEHAVSLASNPMRRALEYI